MRSINKKSKGFTLIELLVVIAIISLLSSIVLASLNSARSKARDATRVSDFHQIELALEMYYNQYGRYPGPIPRPSLEWWWLDNGGGSWLDGLNEFLNPLPHNPSPKGVSDILYYHYYSPSPSQYWLMIGLENGTPGSCPATPTGWLFGGSSTCGWWGSQYLYVRAVK